MQKYGLFIIFLQKFTTTFLFMKLKLLSHLHLITNEFK